MRPKLDAIHLLVENGRAAIVDTGPAPAAGLLLETMQQKNVDPGDVDYLFLTHVHLDHAGGAGTLMESLPNAQAVLHPSGAPHMVNPTLLTRGARAVYGKERFADWYGSIVPVPAERVIEVSDGETLTFGGRELRCFYTEGHARHHYCIDDPASKGVFTGDSFGVSYRELDTDAGEFIFPTTSPIHFDPPEAHKSVDRIMACDPDHLYLTHYSRIAASDRVAADMHRGIDDFAEIAITHADVDERTDAIQNHMFEYLSARLAEHGYGGTDLDMHAALDFDVWLNTMGLEVWLDNRSRG